MTEDTQVLDPGLDPAEEPPAPQLPPGKPMKLPDTTRIQLIALAQAGLAVAIAFGVPISQEQSVALVALAGILGTVLITADASIRRERARNADKLRPVAQISGTMPSGDVASVRMPMAETRRRPRPRPRSRSSSGASSWSRSSSRPSTRATRRRTGPPRRRSRGRAAVPPRPDRTPVDEPAQTRHTFLSVWSADRRAIPR